MGSEMCIRDRNSDYVGVASTSITFDSGAVTGTRRCTSITINEDSIVEYDETFNVVLTENSNRLEIQTGRNYTQITIIEDNDCESVIMSHSSFYTFTIDHMQLSTLAFKTLSSSPGRMHQLEQQCALRLTVVAWREK